jgi:hypothetical protein
MKKLFTIKYLILSAILLATILGLSNCTKHDQLIDETASALADQATTLVSSKLTGTLNPDVTGTLGYTWNGTTDAIWEKAAKITAHAVVPDLGNNTFAGFIGNATDVTLRSVYDASNIYFLVEWNCDQKNVQSAPWYFNPTTKLWAQESGAPVLNSDGTYRPPFIQDQFAIMFNIANSVPNFKTLSCYSACHANTSFGSTIIPPAGGVMFTNGPTEKLDCWRARMLQVVNCNQANDTYIDWGDGVINKNEVHNDNQVKSTDGGISNKQNLKIKGKTTKEAVPMWINIKGNYSNGAIMASDTVNNPDYVFVTAVDSFGVLSYAASRGGAVINTIDPNTLTNYQQKGSGDGTLCIPGSIVAPYSGSRGDVTANAFFTGTGWKLMLKRSLNTHDTSNNDVDFSTLADQYFGIGVMFNGADNEHAIANGLLLRFKK